MNRGTASGRIDTVTRSRAAAALAGAVLVLTLAFTATSTAQAQMRGRLATVWAKGQGSVRLHYLERGQGPALLLLHGLGASSYFWRHVLPGLARTHRVIALDLKGFGRSAKPLDGRYSIVDQANLVRAFIRSRGLSNVAIVGHSLGGAVALAATLQDRWAGERSIKRLALIAAPGLPQALPGPLEMLQRPGLGELALDIAPPELVAKLTLESATLDTSRITDRDIAAYAAPLASPGGREALIATARALEPERFSTLIRRYGEIDVPTLLLWCRGDRIVPLSTGQRLAKRLARARLEVMEGCNHVPAEEKPAETLVRLRAFLAKP